jgi:predicted nucleotidyltransferase
MGMRIYLVAAHLLLMQLLKKVAKMLNSDVKQEIHDCLSKPPKPFRVILFGSYAYGLPQEDSDIDLLVILDREGKSDSYRKLIQNRQEISGRMQSLKKNIRLI